MENNYKNFDVKIALFGDDLVKYLVVAGSYLDTELYSKNMTINDLITKLLSTTTNDNVDHVFFSIGKMDRFKLTNNISFLCETLMDKFPNANINVIKALIDENYLFIDGDNSEKKIMKFYNEFKKNGVNVIGKYDSLDVNLSNSDKNINNIKTKIKNSIYQNNSKTNFIVGGNNINRNVSVSRYNRDISGEDSTDYDTIYEFLDRFDEMVKSNNHYYLNIGTSFKPDIEQIQITLKFLGYDLDINGKYDRDTQLAVREYQEKNKLEETGECDSDTLEDMYYQLKVDGFNDLDISKFIKSVGISGSLIGGGEAEVYLNGKVDIVGSIGGDALSNVNLMISDMVNYGITNPYTQIGILAVFGKECGYIPKSEVCYDGTSNGRIRELFGKYLTNYDEKELNDLKDDCEKFFDAVYGKESNRNWDTGNDNVGDGYKYRGRGFNQITFKSTYKKYGDMIGEDLVGNPDKLNDVNVASKAALAFLTKGKPASSIPEFTNIDDAVRYFVNINAGGVGSSENHGSADEKAKLFEVIP
jgi:predicted chitinase